MMKVILLLTLSCVVVYADRLNVNQCSGKQGTVHVSSASTDPGTGTILNKNSNIIVKYDSVANFNSNDRIVIKINLKKWMFITYVSIPETIISLAASKMDDPLKDIKYLGNRKFELGCPTLVKYVPCPPSPGQHEFKIALKEIFEKVTKLSGSFGSFFGSGWIKIEADVGRPTGERIACLNMELNIKL